MNSVYRDEAAHNEPSHLHLHCSLSMDNILLEILQVHALLCEFMVRFKGF